MKSWNVLVEGCGYIGQVQEETEEYARCAALFIYHEDGDRPNTGGNKGIYENDEFSVSAV